MDLTRRFDPKRMRAWLASLVCAFLLLGVVAAAVADLPEDHPRRNANRGGLSPAAGNVLSRHVMDRNRVLMFLTDVGEIGSSGSSVAGGGFWLAQSNQYIFSSGLNVGAVLPNGTIVVAIGGPFSEFHFGSLEFPEFPSSSGLGHGVSSPGGVIWDSTIDDGLEMPEQCTVDAFRVAQFPSLQPFSGDPFPGFADQTVCMAVNDITGGTCSDCAGTRVGVEIIETLFAFGVPSVQDFVFAAFRVFNRSQFVTAANSPAQPAGPYDLSETIVAVAVDPDIGDASDDQIAFLPEVQTMVFWDVDFNEPDFQGIPGFGGISYLKTPIDPATGEEVGLREFTVFTNGPPRPDPSTKEVWYALMIGDVTETVLEVDPRDVRGMASSGPFVLPAGEFVEVYGAFFYANVSGSPPADLRAEAYKSLATGELIPDANDHPAFNNFKIVQQTAQATFDAGFLVPTSPPKPNFTLIPGDQQVTIVWGQGSVLAVNPFSKVARDPFARLGTGQPDPDAPGLGVFLEEDQIIYVPALDAGGTTGFVTAGSVGLTGAEVTNAAFNPNFVIQDFQGFRVYRSYTGLASDAELIAQFDLADGITGGVFCIAAQAVFDADGEFVQNVCTAQAELAIGTDSGLSFSVVDRGGTFPDPSDGPGLVNGIPVFYTVNSYGVNCGQSPVDIPPGTDVIPPAACLVLESGLAPLRAATPRSDASSLIAGSSAFDALTAAGEVCDVSEPSATINPQTGDYVDFRDCSNAVRASITEIRGTNIPTGDFLFVVDSITVVPGFYGPPYGIATAGGRIWFHWERADGSLATEITPTVGSFDPAAAFAFTAPIPVAFSLDTDPTDIGGDAAIVLTTFSDYGVMEDLEVNGQSLHKLELGGEHVGEHRPHRVDNSALADIIQIGNSRSITGAAREYSHPGPYATGATSFELTWSVQGGVYSGTMRVLPTGEEVPMGGQPKGPANPSTPGDFVAGWNWGFLTAATQPALSGMIMTAAPLTNVLNLAPGANIAVFMPGHSVGLFGLRDLPEDGDVWTFFQDPGFQRGFFGREGPDDDGLWTYNDFNQETAQGHAFPLVEGITGLRPGSTFRLSLQGATNVLAEADLNAIKVVPNPFIAANEITRGRGLQRLQFTNLPPQATIRIYTISGNLVRVLEHSDGSGTAEWDVRTRYDLLAASGNYYYHVTTPDGRTHLGRFAVIN